ncbi:complement component 7b isoform X2 [Megalobrama amblycephala]|uniref:complement component 7b isoform X2 n=1 Tax=Megalobrama amblycephala TaxID=75352 RepID=UPI0020145B82|nr:complement component 7b isoform X2 [Megalobrama amblycephala]
MCPAVLLVLVTFLPYIWCEQPVNCRWGPYGDWSECDGCTKTQVRWRHVETFPQFGGSTCTGEAIQKQSCFPKKSCPLQTGCGNRFRCTSGQCINPSLLCNGDHDCEDGLDEQRCSGSGTIVCNEQKPPPNSDLTGRGFDVLTGELRAGVINTRTFGGQCRKIFSGDHRDFYRLPQSLLRYSFQVRVENDFSEEYYDSSWSYMRHEEERKTIRGGHDHKTFHNELKQDKTYHLLIIRNEVEVAQFQNNAPEYLPLSEDFWKDLSALPSTYDPSAYRLFIQRYGTHYMEEGSLGGYFGSLETLKLNGRTDIDFHQCITRVKRRLFYKKKTTKCVKLMKTIESFNENKNQKMPVKTDIIGGHTAYIAGLSLLDLENPDNNKQMYSKWAGSVKEFPKVIKQKLRPLYELVKEVPCAGLKKIHLKRALEVYLEEQSPCHCSPCQNNGMAVLTEGVCTCVCRPGTSGNACQNGHVLGEQPGVIEGRWSCWSAWSSCSRGQKSRTRSCNNPAPRNGGRNCIGETIERKNCEDPDFDHLRMMEPQFFDPTLTPVKTCKTPPPLTNGFVLDPKDIYPVGRKIEYTCADGHDHIGNPIAECTENLTWKMSPMECKKTACDPPAVLSNVIATPSKQAYLIGESVTLSCPSGMQKEGEAEIMCRLGLSWYPSPETVRCNPVEAVPTQPSLFCKPWEKQAKGQCVCKMPYECKASLHVCASVRPGRVNRMSICQLGAFQCLRQTFSLLQDSACSWPETKFTSCQDCHQWETCDGFKCECIDPDDCSDDSAHLCVSLKGGAPEMISECEAGAWRCQGKEITVLSIGDCQT